MTDLEQIKLLRLKLYAGEINYMQAKNEARPFIENINKKGIEIAKKYNQRFKKISFAGLMR